MLSVQVFGPRGRVRNTAPEYFGSMGVAHGPLRRRHSGKGRAVPERPPVDPNHSSARCVQRGTVCSCPCSTTSRISFDRCIAHSCRSILPKPTGTWPN